MPKSKKSYLCCAVVKDGLRAIQFPEESHNDWISNALKLRSLICFTFLNILRVLRIILVISGVSFTK